MPRGAFRQGTGASCLRLRQAATAAATVWIAELAVMPRPGAWRAVPTARWCRCGVGQDGAILSLLRRQAAALHHGCRHLQAALCATATPPQYCSPPCGRASKRAASATAQPTSVPPLFAWRRNTGFGALVEFGRQRDHALNQGADFWNDGLQTPHFREFGDTKILFLPLVELP